MGRLEFSTLPVPAFAEHTVRIPAGVVTFGVEYRHLDEATILAFYGPDSRAKFGNQMPAGMTAVVEEDGLSLHVFDSATGDELLRFDCFAEAAHWHLLSAPDSRNVVIEHDVRADGPLVEWALATMRADLRALLREAGADAVADALDDGVVASALDTVTQTARYVVAAGRPVRVD
jgi:hypothetical protein